MTKVIHEESGDGQAKQSRVTAKELSTPGDHVVL